MINLKDARTETPSPGLAWQQLSDAGRLTLANDALRAATLSFRDAVAITAAKEDGQIIVKLARPLPPGERGALLLDLEACLKAAVDHGLAVWLEPLGDRNSLRNLRGIEVKA